MTRNEEIIDAITQKLNNMNDQEKEVFASEMGLYSEDDKDMIEELLGANKTGIEITDWE